MGINVFCVEDAAVNHAWCRVRRVIVMSWIEIIFTLHKNEGLTQGLVNRLADESVPVLES